MANEMGHQGMGTAWDGEDADWIDCWRIGLEKEVERKRERGWRLVTAGIEQMGMIGERQTKYTYECPISFQPREASFDILYFFYTKFLFPLS